MVSRAGLIVVPVPNAVRGFRVSCLLLYWCHGVASNRGVSELFVFLFFIWRIKLSHKSLPCSQRQIHTVQICKQSQAKTTSEKTFRPIKYIQPLHPSTPSRKCNYINIVVKTLLWTAIQL